MRVLVIAVAAMLTAALGPAGAVRAAPASVPPGALIAAVGGSGHEAPAAGAQQCFYTFPNCTSTDPTAEFRIVSNGDTSSCTFQYKSVWGDGKTSTKSFPGGPDGATLATFSHTYNKKMPQTWTISLTGTVTSGTCGADSGTLMFTLLPKLGVGAVRFAPLAGQSTNTTPGLPVIKDDGPSPTMDNQWGPTSCDGITSPRDYDYEDCAKPVPSGSPAKIWPVIYASGSTLTIDQAVFAANGQVPDPQLTATASLSGSATASFSLPATTLSQAKAGSGYLLTGSSLTFTGALPDVPGRDKLTIKWTVTDLASGLKVQTVTSSHVLYVTAGTYAAPTGGVPTSEEKPYVTVLNTGIVPASGVSGQQNVFNAIWQKFTTLTIKHPILDPSTGLVSDGNAMTYYNNGFTTLSDGFDGDRSGCRDLLGMLQTDSGHCGAWAMFFAMVMAFQGITAQEVGLGDATGPNGFQPGPAPAGGCTAAHCAYMLVGPNLWHFKGATAGGTYPYRDKLTVTSTGAISITGSQITYSSTSAIAQGPVSTPPMWFTDGDHAIDEVTLPGGMKWVDPSYGDPMPPLTPFANVKTYEPHALAGFAVVYKVTGGTLKPLPATYSKSAIAAACTGATCYLQA
ncbi:MAG TPA: hypothetical protein VGI74_12525, partial [Streptosporangiaceae bacterium]